MDFTHEQLAELATSGNPLDTMMLLSTGSAPMEQLAMAGQLVRVTIALEEEAEGLADEPQHGDIRKAIETAADAARVALEASVNMVYDLAWQMENCKCVSCSMNRQRGNAGSN